MIGRYLFSLFLLLVKVWQDRVGAEFRIRFVVEPIVVFFFVVTFVLLFLVLFRVRPRASENGGTTIAI